MVKGAASLDKRLHYFHPFSLPEAPKPSTNSYKPLMLPFLNIVP